MQAMGFVPHAVDRRVWLEPGAESYADRVVSQLDLAVFRVERLHGLPFLAPPKVYVCATPACFTRLVQTPGLTAAVVPDNRLILSPRLHGPEAHRLAGILAHELSHLHLGQRLGHYTPWIPVWFHEGLATLVAEGAGAELGTDQAACDAWRAGRAVDFSRRDVPGRRHRAADFGLDIGLFYRQSWRMLALLRDHDPDAFLRWLKMLQEGADFHIAFADVYATDMSMLTRLLCEVAASDDARGHE